MNDHGAPASLAHAADQRAVTAEQDELLIKSRMLEHELDRLVRRVRESREHDSGWLTVAHVSVKTGFMQLNRAILKKDFF